MAKLCLTESHISFQELQELLKQKFTKKGNINQITAQLLRCKMGPTESLIHYKDRFEKLVRKYKKMVTLETVVNQNKQNALHLNAEPSNSTGTSADANTGAKFDSKKPQNQEKLPSPKLTPDFSMVDETENPMIIMSESALIKAFIDGLQSKQMRKDIRCMHARTVKIC